jgi:hypothetical protein
MWNMKCMNVPIVIRTIRIVTRGLKKNLEAISEKKFDRFTTKERCTWNITHNTGSIAV